MKQAIGCRYSVAVGKVASVFSYFIKAICSQHPSSALVNGPERLSAGRNVSPSNEVLKITGPAG